MATSKSSSQRSVCIVGAGIAGLRCATVLIEAGCTVTIAEARNRIGGRICQSSNFDYCLDMGPNWINTYSVDHTIMKLAQETNTPLHLYSDGVRIFASNGEELDGARAVRLQNLIWDMFKSSITYSSYNHASISPISSLYDHVQGLIRDSDVSDDDRQILTHLSEMWGNYTGEPIQKQSLKYAYTEAICGGEAYYVATDFSAILAHAAKIPQKHADIQLNTKVVGIGDANDEQQGQGMVRLLFDNGRTSCFDDVVLTAPLGWLKLNTGIFHPPLDESVCHAIESISYGHLEKVYIEFETSFWKQGAGADPDPDAGHFIWLNPDYAPDTNPSRWSMAAWDLAAFSPHEARPVLLFYVFGGLASHVSSITQHNKDRSAQQALLDGFFCPYFSKLPNYSATSPTCKPKTILATDWRSDELAGYGSYCTVNAGVEGADRHIKTLQNGLPNRHVWFAGEHAAPVDERGTVCGAWLSGEAAARKLIDSHLSRASLMLEGDQ